MPQVAIRNQLIAVLSTVSLVAQVTYARIPSPIQAAGDMYQSIKQKIMPEPAQTPEIRAINLRLDDIQATQTAAQDHRNRNTRGLTAADNDRSWMWKMIIGGFLLSGIVHVATNISWYFYILKNDN